MLRMREENGHQAFKELQREVFKQYGNVCACCGTADNPTLDHVNPTLKLSKKVSYAERRAAFKDALKNPSKYQQLCDPCNRWKAIGPRCPCHWWDEIAPGWRKST